MKKLLPLVALTAAAIAAALIAPAEALAIVVDETNGI